MKKVLLGLAACLAAGATWVEAQTRSDYVIAPNDIIVIDVLGEVDMSREFRVSGTGTINYFFLGEVRVAGRTTTEVREELTERLNRDYLVEPQVRVDVKEYRIREVFVNGQVNRPGSILLTGEQDLTILGVLARAGGLTSRASENKIKFTRPGLGEKTKTYSLDDLKKEKDQDKIMVMPGDIIEVGDKLL